MDETLGLYAMSWFYSAQKYEKRDMTFFMFACSEIYPCFLKNLSSGTFVPGRTFLYSGKSLEKFG